MIALQQEYSNTKRKNFFVGRARVSSSESAGSYKPAREDFIGSFYAVLERWERETSALSDPSRIKKHPAFRALVSHADLTLPMIMAELNRKPSFLVWVLNEAFVNDPTAPRVAGNLRAITNAWLQWGKMNGHAR